MPEDDDPPNRSQVDFPGPVPARCVWPEICAADPASQGSRRGNPQVARRELVVAADGAVSLLEKLSPALERVDSSFGAPGTAVNRAVDALVPVMAGVDAPPSCGNAGSSVCSMRCRMIRCRTSSVSASVGANCV